MAKKKQDGGSEGVLPGSSGSTGSKPAASKSMENFEARLERLEKLDEAIRKPELPLEEALKAFEEGIKLARSLEKDLEKIEGRIEILMNAPEARPPESPELDLFEDEN
jgi:exodeoxyribonuclease VII small subunit